MNSLLKMYFSDALKFYQTVFPSKGCAVSLQYRSFNSTKTNSVTRLPPPALNTQVYFWFGGCRDEVHSKKSFLVNLGKSAEFIKGLWKPVGISYR